jgi:predicted ArsR family transcriptional regulator
MRYTINANGRPRVPQRPLPPDPETMAVQRTKSQILTLLKRSGGSTVEELASALELARMTVRQHLATLERDNLVMAREVRRPTGRPHFVYSLTDEGEETFPRCYDRLADMIIDEVALLDSSEIRGLSPAEKKALLFRKLARRIVSQYAERLEGKSLEERVSAAVDILQMESGFAEWHKLAEGFEIVGYNCPYRRVAESQDEVCVWHLELFSQLLGGHVRAAEVQSHGADCCRFIVADSALPSHQEGTSE